MQFSSSLLPWAWAVLALIVAMAELHVPGSYLIWIALAAAVTAVADFLFALSVSAQLAIFSVSVVLSCLVGYYVYRLMGRRPFSGQLLNQRDLELVGAIGTAGEPFVHGQGKARIGDTVWLAEAHEDIPSGTPIIVEAVRGTTLIVTRRSGA
jgi:membrane protein implicated in regulation of membrane protease activity